MHFRSCLTGLALASFATGAVAADTCSVRSGAQTVPLIELYTSEGCSSCPPADRWLSSKLRSGEFQANWLAFHVDYWDDLGWPDRFASHLYTERQRRRVNAAGQSTVYTPQVMIGSQVQTNWRAAPMVHRALDAQRGAAQAGLALQLDHDTAKGRQLRLGAVRSGPGGAAAQVWLAQTVDGVKTEVRAGENGGVTLDHDRVVTKLWGPWALGATPFAKAIEVDLGQGAWGLTAFVQEGNGRVLQSLRLAPADCR
ncbi:MAG: DUF1223 domain-containing protein [Lysobacteraceae bacterium]